MKTYLFILLIGFSLTAFGQFRDDGLHKPEIQDGITNSSSGNLFGFLNSDNFSMKHTLSMSYTAFGGNGISLGTYTNSMYYKMMDNLNVQADVSMVYSPYSTFGKDFQNEIGGIYLSRAAINYSPFKDMHITVQYRNLPYTGNYYSPYYGAFDGYYSNPFFSDINDRP